MEHLAAKLRIHCLERNIDRRQVIFDHPLNILLAHIRQCHIVSLQEGKPGIIILKIESLPHSRRHLVDKAEHAMVAAGTVIIHQAILKLYSQILIIILLHFQLPDLSVGFLYKKFYIFIVHQITVIKNILHRLMIDLCQHISRLQLQLLADASRKNFGNLMFLFFHGVPFFLSFGYAFVHIRIITMITILRVKINKFLDGI